LTPLPNHHPQAAYEALKVAWLVTGSVRSATLAKSPQVQKKLDSDLVAVYTEYYYYFLGVLAHVTAEHHASPSSQGAYGIAYVTEILSLIKAGHADAAERLSNTVDPLVHDTKKARPYRCTCGSCGSLLVLGYEGNFWKLATESTPSGAMTSKTLHNECDELGGTWATDRAGISGSAGGEGGDEEESDDEVEVAVAAAEREEAMLQVLTASSTFPSSAAAAAQVTTNLRALNGSAAAVSASDISKYIAGVVARFSGEDLESVTEGERSLVGRRGAKLIAELQAFGGSLHPPETAVGPALLGQRLKVYYDSHNEWYSGVVIGFEASEEDEEQGTHLVHWDEEADDDWLDLKVWAWARSRARAMARAWARGRGDGEGVVVRRHDSISLMHAPHPLTHTTPNLPLGRPPFGLLLHSRLPAASRAGLSLRVRCWPGYSERQVQRLLRRIHRSHCRAR